MRATPGRGVFLKTFSRDDKVVAVNADTALRHGDVLTIEGATQDVARVAKLIGFYDRPVETTDVSFMALGIVIGRLTIHVGGIPLGLGTSVGAIVAGILCGFLHGKNARSGKYPGRRCGCSTTSD